MTSIATMARTMQTVLTTVAEDAARQSGCVQRVRQFSGATLVETLVFGWLANPSASSHELSQMAATRGVTITPQGLDQRFTPELATCLEQVLATAVTQVITSDPVVMPLLDRFTGVYVQDSTTISLPATLAELWPGCGGKAGQGEAAIKLQVQLELRRGSLAGPLLQAGRAQDRTSPLRDRPLPTGSLRLQDTGYFTLADLHSYAEQGVWTLTRLPANVIVFTADGQRWEQAALLRRRGDVLDLPVTLGVKARVPARLLAMRVPRQVATQRRRRLRREAKKKQQPVSAARLALAAWTLFVTTAPVSLLSLEAALVLARARWQIELLFKLWKQHGQVDASRSTKPWRVLCEVYAKLLAMVIQQWVLLTSCWTLADRSVVKAAQTLREHAITLATAFDRLGRLIEALTTLQRCIRAGCRMTRRKTHVNTYQLLLNPAWEA